MAPPTISSHPPAAPELESVGIVTMKSNREIVLQLRAPLDGGANFGEGYFTYQPGTAEYQKVLRHIGGLEPGQSKPVPPWPETSAPSESHR